jgi:hypothetical protein
MHVYVAGGSSFSLDDFWISHLWPKARYPVSVSEAHLLLCKCFVLRTCLCHAFTVNCDAFELAFLSTVFLICFYIFLLLGTHQLLSYGLWIPIARDGSLALSCEWADKLSQKAVNIVKRSMRLGVQMARLLQQRVVEEQVLSWIKTACMFMVDGGCMKTAKGSKDSTETLAVLREQQDVWKTVCSLFTTLIVAVF